MRVHNENPGLVASSCVFTGGTNDFIYKVAIELKKADRRFGLKWFNGERGNLDQDEVTFAYGTGPLGEPYPHEETKGYHSYRVIDGLCSANPRPSATAVPPGSGLFTNLILEPPETAPIARELPPPFMFKIVQLVHNENPQLIRGACNGDNGFLFAVVERLRTYNPRWGLNWKRGVYGDMSLDVVSFAFDDAPYETSVHGIVDIIKDCGGPNPEPA